MTTALTQLETSSDRECVAWESLGISGVVQLAVTASDGVRSAEQASRQLFNRLKRDLLRMGLQPGMAKCGGSLFPGLAGCWATSHPGAVRRVLVWVSDSAGALPAVAPQGWDTIIPLLPVGAHANVLPPMLRTKVAAFYQPGRIDEVAIDVLLAAGLDVDEQRVFISYRWDDAQAVAEQLFHALSSQRFDVYLDRFRTNPGTDFIERIRRELIDKACVIILDSRDVLKSPWVAGEYGFARKYRLGLMAIDLPGGRKSFHRIGRRIDLSRACPPASFNSGTLLGKPQIDSAVAFIRAHYASEIGRRLRHQRRLIQDAAAMTGVAITHQPNGLAATSSGGYVIGASARPPSLSQFRHVNEVASAVSAKAVVVGPLFAVGHAARQDIDWLTRKSAGVAVDERNLFSAMRRIGAGSL